MPKTSNLPDRLIAAGLASVQARLDGEPQSGDEWRVIASQLRAMARIASDVALSLRIDERRGGHGAT